MFVVDFEPEPADQVQPATGGRAEAGDVAGVWGNLRFPEGDMNESHQESP